MGTKLERIAELSKENPNMVFTSIGHLINKELLTDCHRKMDGDKAVGIDGITKEEYGKNLDANLEDLVSRLKRHSYKPKPARRVEIPKDDGKTRPLSIYCYEDKLIQEALKRVLEAVFEPHFYNEMMGFRPNRDCHMALQLLNEYIERNPTNWILDADIKSFFNHLDHEWIVKFIESRIKDPNIIRLVHRTLKAGIMENFQFEQEIELRDVDFSYIAERPVLKHINLKVPKGKTIALVGQSGSGKSTLVDLIPRYHDVTGGEVLIDGKNIKGLRISDLRALIGNVNQEAILFNDTFYNNITFGVDNATMEQVVEAAKIANAHEFIMESENGYDTMIGDRGGRLSGGQRQRVSIARAILKNPPILILDEATSALDTESERLVQEALERLMKSRTTIAIAHRLSTIKNADEICVLYEGEIVERGQHEELIAKNGYYKRLYDMQQL